MKVFTAFFLIAASVASAGQSEVSATIQSMTERKPAPEFTLTDTSGNTARLADYRGKVVLLDIWATWCGGCKKEIPWFMEFHKTYEAKGLAVVGVSLDDGGWQVLKPWLASHPIPYRVVLGDDAMAKRYAIESMPDSFLIDQQGRVAAAYRGVVDQKNMEANIKALLAPSAGK
jgi:cytochrome c biogenesis protein CcmG/thiol:disulfide interchange protein DsbE